MSLSVVIPSKTSSNLIPCVEAIRKHEGDIRIIVVDNGLAERPDGCEYIDWFKPFVFAAACNAGIRAAGDADLCLTNDDALLESPGGFRLLQEAAEAHPEYGVIGATTNLTGQPLQQRRRLGAKDYGLREVDHIAFVCCLIPQRTRVKLAKVTKDIVELGADCFLTGGLLDERYEGYGSDDLDYCMQAHAVELKVGVLDTCFVDHGRLRSSYRGVPTAAGNIWVNHRILRQKWGMPPNPMDPGK